MTISKTREVFHFIVGKAETKTITTYQEIALACDLPSSGNRMGAVLSPILSSIFLFSYLHDLPFLTSIVVRKSGNEMGLPGVGFWKLLESVSTSALHQNLDRCSRARKDVLTKGFHEEVFHVAQRGAFNTETGAKLDYSLLEIADQEEGVLEGMVQDKLGKLPKAKPAGPNYEPASLEHQQVEGILEEMRKKIAKDFGVTVVQDCNGAHGQAGGRYMTLRFGDNEVSFTINTITSHRADVEYNSWLNEDK